MAAFKSVSNVQTSIVPSDRYPGALPFNDTPLDHLRFFGREEETRLLLHQLLRVDLLVLFAMPGLGKTSLLNAKLFPLLRARDFLPLPVRFNATAHALTPLQVFTAAIEQTCQAEPIDYTAGTKESLWEFFKTAVFWCGDRLQTPVLILDQFEEFFTLQNENFRHGVAAELGQLLGRRLPERVRQHLQEGRSLPFSEKPPEVKILLSVREDDLGLLQEITPEIPTMLQNRFRLTGLSLADARHAIAGPARLVAAEFPFSTKPFAYNITVLEEMTAIARTKEGSIDPFFLQILCNRIEKQVRQKQLTGTATDSSLIVDSGYLGGEQGIKALTASFYLDALNRLTPRKLRRRVRWLCEEGLLTGEGRRRSLLLEEIQERFKLDGQALEPFEHARVLRKEASHGSFTYEISHDRLAEAIQDKRRWRLPREVKIGLTMFMVVLVVAAILFTYFQAESKRRTEETRETVEQVLENIIFSLQDSLLAPGGHFLLDDIQKQIDVYYERTGSMGESDKILRWRAVSYSNRGDLFSNRGYQDLALSSYQIALAIRKQLAARDQTNPQWQRDLTVSYDRIGDVQRDQGNLSASLSSYQQGLQIVEKLAARDPANAQWQTDLVASLYKIAAVLERQIPPRKQEAATNYQRILNILRPLAVTNRLAAGQKGRIADVEERLEALKE